MRQHSLSNPVYFVRKLNEELERIVRESQDRYVVDADSISASIGRRFVQDDPISVINHASMLPDQTEGHPPRMDFVFPTTSYYPNQLDTFYRAVWAETVALFRTLHQVDSVKMVVFDLDDTLWEGVAAEMELVGPHLIEG